MGWELWVRRGLFFFFLAGVGDHMIPEASPPRPPPSVLQPKAGVTLASRGSPALLVCGGLGAPIYRRTHKHRSHFLCLLLGFLLSQNRPVTPAPDLLSSSAQLPRLRLPRPPPGADLCPTQDGRGPVKYKSGRKETILCRTCPHCLLQKGKSQEAPTGSGLKWAH